MKVKVIIVYRNKDYCGKELPVYDTINKIDIGGASSMIISGGCWKLYTQPNVEGPSYTIGPGFYPTPLSMGISK